MFSLQRLITTSLACLSILFFQADAQAAMLKLENASSSEIHAIYISDSGSANWEENIIDGYLLPPGNAVDIQIPSYKSFDLRVEDEAGNYEDYSDFPGRTRYIKIQGGGQSSYR